MKYAYCVAVLLAGLCQSGAAQAQTGATGPVVIEVGATVVTRGEFDRLFDVALRLLASEQGITLDGRNAEQIQTLRRQYLNQRANEMTLVAEAQRRNINVSDKDIAEQYTAAVQAITDAGGPVDEQILRDLLKDKRRVALLSDQLRAEIEVRPGEVMVMHHDLQDQLSTPEQICMRHIQLADAATADKLLVELQAGADFAEMARLHSADKTTAQHGGDTGCFPREHMIPTSDFERAVFTARENVLTGPVRSDHGYHLLVVYDRKPPEVPTLNQVYKDLEKEIRDEKLPAKLTAIRDASGVVTWPERLDP